MVLYFHLTSIFTANLSLSAEYLCLTLSDSLFHLWPAPSPLFVSPCLLRYFILSLPFPICHGLVWIDLLSSPSYFQEVFLRLMQLSAITTVLAAKKKCNGWGKHTRRTNPLVFVVFITFCRLLFFAQWKISFSWYCLISLSHSVCYCLFPSSSLFQDVDTIYHSQDNREFNLLDFSHLDSRWGSLLTLWPCLVLVQCGSSHWFEQLN